MNSSDEESWVSDDSLSSEDDIPSYQPGFQKLKCARNQSLPNAESKPFPRSGHRTVANNKYMVAIGGYNPNLVNHNDLNDEENPILQDVWLFNLITKRWNEVKCRSHAGYEAMAVDANSVPRHLASHSAVLHDNYVLIFGGSAYPFGQSSSNDLYTLKIESDGHSLTGLWRRVDTAEDTRPPQQYGHAMLLHDKKLYIIGGTSGHQFNMEVYELALEDIMSASGELRWNNILKGPEAMPRYRHEAFMLDGNIVVLGGGTANTVCSLTNVDVFDFVTGRWTIRRTSPDPTHGYPAPRRCHGLAQISDTGAVYISGGTDSTQHLAASTNRFDDVWILNTNLAWEKFPYKLPEPMYFHAMAITPNCSSLLVFGGVVKADGRSGEIYRCRLKPPPLEELALSALVDRLLKIDSYENLNTHLERLAIPKSCMNWVNGVWS